MLMSGFDRVDLRVKIFFVVMIIWMCVIVILCVLNECFRIAVVITNYSDYYYTH